MARYQMKQKWISWGDDYVVRNEQGDETFFIDGKKWSLSAKLSFQDMQGNELAYISQKLLAWGPTFEISRSGSLFAVIKLRNFLGGRVVFSIDVPGPNDLTAEGNFFSREYTFTRGARTVARVSKTYFSWTDTYGIDVSSGEDDILLIASAVVIDQCVSRGK